MIPKSSFEGKNNLSSYYMTKALKHNIAFLEGLLAFSKPAIRSKVKKHCGVIQRPEDFKRDHSD
jgi:hypothetical protein